jgi:hypothetical protein
LINELPAWVEIGGFFPTFVAGSINAIALRGFDHRRRREGRPQAGMRCG